MNSTPQILCDDPQTVLTTLVPQIYQRLKDTLTQAIINDTEEYNNIIQHGLSTKLSITIFNFLYEELRKLTKHKHREWCEYSTTTIIKNINLVIIGLIEIKKLNQLTADELTLLLYRVTTYQLHEENKIDGILDNIFYYDDSYSNSSDVETSSSENSSDTESSFNTDSSDDKNE
jgi:hypothetical protein